MRGLTLVLLLAALCATTEALPVQGDTVSLGAGAPHRRTLTPPLATTLTWNVLLNP